MSATLKSSPLDAHGLRPASLLDVSVLEACVGSSADVLIDILGDFRDLANKLGDDVKRGLESGDAAAVAMAAHSLKGSSGFVGADLLRVSCDLVERAAADGVEAARALASSFEDVRAATVADVDRRIAKLSRS